MSSTKMTLPRCLIENRIRVGLAMCRFRGAIALAATVAALFTSLHCPAEDLYGPVSLHFKSRSQQTFTAAKLDVYQLSATLLGITPSSIEVVDPYGFEDRHIPVKAEGPVALANGVVLFTTPEYVNGQRFTSLSAYDLTNGYSEGTPASRNATTRIARFAGVIEKIQLGHWWEYALVLTDDGTHHQVQILHNETDNTGPLLKPQWVHVGAINAPQHIDAAYFFRDDNFKVVLQIGGEVEIHNWKDSTVTCRLQARGVRSLNVSYDLLATATENSVSVWQGCDHQPKTFDLDTHASVISAVAVEPRGRFVAVGTTAGEVELCTLPTRFHDSALTNFENQHPEVRGLQDGYALDQETCQKWSTNQGIVKAPLVQMAFFNDDSQPENLSRFREMHLLTVDAASRTAVWNPLDGSLVRVVSEPLDRIVGAQYSRPNSQIVTATLRGDLVFWHVDAGVLLKRISLFANDEIRADVGTRDRSSETSETFQCGMAQSDRPKVLDTFTQIQDKLIVAGDSQSTMRIVDARADTIIETLTSHLLMSADQCRGGLKRFEVATGRHLRGTRSLAFEGSQIAVAYAERVEVWDGDRRISTIINSLSPSRILFSRTHRYVGVLYVDGSLHILDQELRNKFVTPSIRINRRSRIHRKGKLIAIATLSDSSGVAVDLYTKNRRKRLSELYSFPSGTWTVVATALNLFDSNELQHGNGLQWNTEGGPLPLDLFLHQAFQPNLLGHLAGGKNLEKFQPDAMNRLLPSVSISAISVSRETSRVTVEAEPRGQMTLGPKPPKEYMHPFEVTSGLHDIRLFRDGRLVSQFPPRSPNDATVDELARNRKFIRNSMSRKVGAHEEITQWRLDTDVTTRIEKKPGDLHYQITFDNIALPSNKPVEDVAFSVYAFNDDRAKSITNYRRLRLRPLQHRRRRAYVIGFGVNIAQDTSKWDLSYAAADATAFIDTLQRHLPDTFEFVPIRLLSDYKLINHKRIVTEAASTRSNLRTVLLALAGGPVPSEYPGLQKATPDDVVFLSISSHGFTDSGGLFHIIPFDVNDGGTSATFNQSTITAEDLEGWISEIDAAEFVIIIDACESSNAVETQGFKPGPLGSRSFGQLAYDKQMRVLSATRGKQVALETGQSIQHGILSYALLVEGLDFHKAAIDPKDGSITLREWLDYAIVEVPRIYQALQNRHTILKLDVHGTTQAVRVRGKVHSHILNQQPVLYDFAGESDVIFPCEKDSTKTATGNHTECKHEERQK
jgi:hypothetical protein